LRVFKVMLLFVSALKIIIVDPANSGQG